MKHHLLTAFLLTFLALPAFAQLTCDYIDPVCQKARELMSQGQYDQALRGLEKAKSDPGIRNCSDVYKIDELIKQIQKKQSSTSDTSSTSSQASLSCPDSNHPHLIDLGLPSGTKWACCNVGASRPEDYGNYYAWGETTTKSTYDWSNYKWGRGGKSDKVMKYCTQKSDGKVDNKTMLEPDDDAASANWGSSWRMPTQTQFLELLDKCTLVWTSINGVSGRKFIGPNGASIFLPAAAGDRWDNSGVGGRYWSSTLYKELPSSALGLYIDSDDANTVSSSREWRRVVRPVSSN